MCLWTRCYRGVKNVAGTEVVIPGKISKKLSYYHQKKRRKRNARRVAIESAIGHLEGKSSYTSNQNQLDSQSLMGLFKIRLITSVLLVVLNKTKYILFLSSDTSKLILVDVTPVTLHEKNHRRNPFMNRNLR